MDAVALLQGKVEVRSKVSSTILSIHVMSCRCTVAIQVAILCKSYSDIMWCIIIL